MKRNTTDEKVVPLNSTNIVGDALTELCREGARKMLQLAVEQEVSDYIDRFSDVVGADGKRLVVRNGHQPERNIQTGIGNLSIKKPKVNDKRIDDDGIRQRFNSSILPPYLRRTKSVEELIPWLYLRGISTGDFSEGLGSILGQNASGLSATNVVRMKKHWENEFTDWNKRDLSNKHYVYFWADGVYPRLRLEERSRQCFLVIMGATIDGKKELVAIGDGYRETEIGWHDVLLDLQRRGLKKGPSLAAGDGALGFWLALSKVYPDCRHQRCWVHKTANILSKLPKTQHGRAKSHIHEIYNAATRTEANQAFDTFLEVFYPKYEKATKCLSKDRDELLSFYDFPAEHWKHLRTSNPIESMFATIRLRTKRTKGHGSVTAALTMAFKLAQCAEKRWRRLDGPKLLADVINVDFKFVDGIRNAA